MKISFRYKDHTAVYEYRDGRGYTDHHILDPGQAPDDDGHQIDLTGAGPADIEAYRAFTRQNWTEYTCVYTDEIKELVFSHADGNPDAKADAERLYWTNIEIAGVERPMDFEPYFAKMVDAFVPPKDDGGGNLVKMSLSYGKSRSMYAFDQEAGKVSRHVLDGVPPKKDEFVIDLNQTDPAEIRKYGLFVSANLEMYLHMLGSEVRDFAGAYHNGIHTARDYAEMLYDMNQKFSEAALTIPFEEYFEGDDSVDRMADMWDKTLRRVSFGFGAGRSQYVAEKGADRHRNRYEIGDEPRDSGELVIELGETDPGKITEYKEFVTKNPDLYLDVFMAEMIALVIAHASDSKDAKKRARALFEMNSKIRRPPKFEFEEFFEKHAETARTQMAAASKQD